VVPVFERYFPEGQLKHELAAVFGLYLPGPHTEQSEELSWYDEVLEESLRYFPAGHAVHDVAEPVLYLPEPHVVQDPDEPYLPALQDVEVEPMQNDLVCVPDPDARVVEPVLTFHEHSLG
jgi:hypothetical protein